MLKTRVISTALAIALSLSGSILPGAQVLAAAKDEPPPQYETRVYTKNNCLLQPEVQPEFLGALAAIFLPIVIEKLLGGAAAALKKAGSDETLRDSGRLPTYLYQLVKGADKNQFRLNPDFKCVVVVRGSFDRPGQPAPASPPASVSTLRSNGIPVREIALLYEGMVRIADDTTALLYESRYLEVNSFLGTNPKKGKTGDRRALVVGLTITGVGNKEGEPVLSLAMVNLGEVTSGTILKAQDLAEKQSSWLGGLAISEATLKAVEAGNLPVKDILNVMPITIEATIAETRSGNAALKFIGEVLDAAKTDVAKAVSTEVLERGKRADEAASALEKLRQEEEANYAELLKAELELIQNPPLSNPATEAEKKALAVKRLAVETAGRAWCLKFEALKRVGQAPARPDHKCPITIP